MQDSLDAQFASAARLVEAILCDKIYFSLPREISWLRWKAAETKLPEERELRLREAAKLCDSLGTYSWHEGVRSHFELAEHCWKTGKKDDCAQELDIVLGLLRRNFSPGNYGMIAMHRIRAVCLRAAGCELGAQREEKLAACMEFGVSVPVTEKTTAPA